MLIGANSGGSGISQNSAKHANISCPQYISDTQTGGFRLLSAYGNDGANYVYIGGNDDNVASTDSAPKSATEVRIYTAATATGNGVQALKNDSSQNATFAGDVSIGGSINETIHTIASASATQDIDPANGTIQRITLSQAGHTITFTNMTNGESVLLMVEDGSSGTVTTWTGVTWVGGSAPTLATSGYSLIEVWKAKNAANTDTVFACHMGDVA